MAWKRGGLHKLECAGCDAYVYGTVASLEKHGLPQCGCSRRFEPTTVELCLTLGIEDTWVFRVFVSEASRVMQGQIPHIARGHKTRNAETVALDRMAAERESSARKRRIAAIQPRVPELMPF